MIDMSDNTEISDVLHLCREDITIPISMNKILRNVSMIFSIMQQRSSKDIIIQKNKTLSFKDTMILELYFDISVIFAGFKELNI